MNIQLVLPDKTAHYETVPRAHTVAIMQPTFLPWAGYFNLIASSDQFIFLDDVQISKRSWQTRNRILLNGKTHFITIPVVGGGRQLLANTFACDKKEWLNKHLNILKQAYNWSPWFPSIFSIYQDAYANDENNLVRMNIRFITLIAKELNINTPVENSSNFRIDEKRSCKIAEICKSIGAKIYLSPQGSRDYLINDDFENLANINIAFQDYTILPYFQHKNSEFISHLSIFDVWCNLGPEKTRSYCLGAMK
jgi:hypothetical protein